MQKSKYIVFILDFNDSVNKESRVDKMSIHSEINFNNRGEFTNFKF